MKKYFLSLSSLLLLGGISFSGEKEVTLKLSQALELHGGLSAGYFYSTNPIDKREDSEDKFQITNAILDFSGEVGKSFKIGFDLAIGGALWATVYDGGQGDFAYYDPDDKSLKEGVGLLWGYVSIKPLSKLSIDAGVLTTNVGYELADTYSNPNITFGAVWYAQPFIYPGARITFSPLENLSLYAEYNQEYDTDNYAVGVIGEFAGFSYALNYYDYRANKNLVDLVLGYSIGNVDLGLNFDYQWLDDTAKKQLKEELEKNNVDDSAYGVAVYFIPKFETSVGKFSIPVRLEYFDEGTSGIYYGGADKGYTVTVTPTLRPTSNTYIRAEVAYINTDNKIFKGGTKDNKTTIAVEAAFTF